MTPARLFIGLDAGGTKTEIRVQTAPGADLWSRTGPPGNLLRQGLDATAQVLARLIREALAAHPGSVLHSVCAGVAGAGSPADQEALAAALHTLLGAEAPRHLRVEHDAAIALEGALEGASGLIVIAGTGSILFARAPDGTLLRAGGWGYLIGDEGSGHTLGARGLRAVAAAFDGGPPTRLRQLLADRHGLDTPDAIRHHLYQRGWPLQRMAPLVLDAAETGDPEALRIVAEQTRALAGQAAWLAARAPDLLRRLAVLGGLTLHPFYHRALNEALRQALPGWTHVPPAHPPVLGALRLALAADG